MASVSIDGLFTWRHVVMQYLSMSARFEERCDASEPVAIIPHDCVFRVGCIVRYAERVLEYCSAYQYGFFVRRRNTYR